MSRPDAASAALAAVATIPRDADGPVFREPWEAQAFALVLRLHEQGCFTWPQWAEALGAEIRKAGVADSGDAYYLHWLAALERLVTQTSLVSAAELRERKRAWARAARATPHGEPIVLGRERAAAGDTKKGTAR